VVKFIALPSRTRQPVELAVNGPQALLRTHGWSTVDAMGASRTLWDYRDFIQRSRAEFGVAKHTYVANRSGWFSDRTECYLAAGRPALVQDTGWTAHLPLNEGLVARGHQVTLFATGDSRTKAHLHALFPHGYWHDHDMWPWEMYEMMNLAAAVEHSRQFDIIHFQAAYYPMSLPFSRLSH